MRLLRKDSRELLVSKLERANTFWQRLRGLLGRSSLAADEGLWIPRCNSVHTFFMRFPIDLIFLNSKMRITHLAQRIPPGRLVLPVWSATSVIELREGFIEQHQLQVGEELHVDSTLP